MTSRFTPLLVACCLAAKILPAQAVDAPLPAPARRPGAVQVPRIEAPANPARVKGTFTVGTGERTLTDGDFYQAYLLLRPHEERPDRPLAENTVLVHILLAAEAEALGFAPADEEMDAMNPLKTNPAMAENLLRRWELQGIDEAKYLAYIRQTTAIARMKDAFASMAVVNSEAIYENWKKDNLLHRIAYVEFAAADEERQLRAKTPTDEDLRRFWESSPVAQNLYRIPTSVTVDMVVFDPASLDKDELAQLRRARPISDKEALAYFNKDAKRFTAMVPSEKRHLLHPSQKLPLDQIVTPFELVRDRVEEEILLGDRISRAFEQVKAADQITGDLMKKAAQQHGLRFHRAEAMTREECATKLEQFGPNLFNQIFNTEPGALCGSIVFEGPLKFFWRLDEKNVSTLPAFEAVRDKLIETYIRETAYSNAWEAAKGFIARMEERLAAEVKPEEDEIDRKAALKAAEDAARAGAREPRELANYQNQHRALADNEKRMLRASRAPKYFDSLVASEGLALKEFGPFTFRFEGIDRQTLASDDQLRSFFESSFQIKSLEPGSVTLAPLSDATTRAHYIVKVVDREEPPFEMMPVADYHRLKINLERQAIFQSNYEWSPFETMTRLQWKAR